MRKIILLILLIFVDYAILQKSELKKKSLLLVADVTGSMTAEIEQLRESCTTILNSFSSRKNKPIANYVISLFRDRYEPSDVFPPIINTTNPLDIQRELNSTRANGGGGDCPESPFTGIERALPYALPHSIVYVFTDAGSNDVKKTERRVKKILQEKQIKVTFFLSHHMCLASSVSSSLVYQKMAEETGGQTLNMEKKSVKEVLGAISDQLEDNYTPLDTVKHEPGTHTENLDVASILSKLIIILQNSQSGNADNTMLIGIDPENITHTGKPLGSNAGILTVENPVPGKWIIQSRSDTPYENSIAGLSEVNFDYVFSLHKTTNKSETTYQPIKNMKNYLNIFVSNPKEVKNLDKVVLDFADSQQDWELFKINDGLYSTQPKNVPNKPFKMNLFGTDKNDLQIKQVLSTTIEPIEPPKPSKPVEKIQDIETLLKKWGLSKSVIKKFKEADIKVESLKTMSDDELGKLLESFPATTLRKVKRNLKSTFKNN